MNAGEFNRVDNCVTERNVDIIQMTIQMQYRGRFVFLSHIHLAFISMDELTIYHHCLRSAMVPNKQQTVDLENSYSSL